MVNKNILKVDGVWIPNPQTMQWAIQDLDSEDGAGRNQQGLMFRDRVAQKIKLTCIFPPMEAADVQSVLTAVNPVFITLEYPDLYTKARKTITAYVGDRTAPIYYYNSTEGKWLCESLSVNFIER